MKMEYTAQVLRGWPNDGALERVEVIKSTTLLSNGGSGLKNGDVVVKQSDGTVDKVGTTSVGNVGLVIRGDADSSSVAAAGGRAVVLWSNYIVQVTNSIVGGGGGYNTTSLPTAWAPGVAVTGGGTSATGKFNTTTATDSTVIGYCLNVIATSNTESASVVILVK